MINHVERRRFPSGGSFAAGKNDNEQLAPELREKFDKCRKLIAVKYLAEAEELWCLVHDAEQLILMGNVNLRRNDPLYAAFETELSRVFEKTADGGADFAYFDYQTDEVEQQNIHHENLPALFTVYTKPSDLKMKEKTLNFISELYGKPTYSKKTHTPDECDRFNRAKRLIARKYKDIVECMWILPRVNGRIAVLGDISSDPDLPRSRQLLTELGRIFSDDDDDPCPFVFHDLRKDDLSARYTVPQFSLTRKYSGAFILYKSKNSPEEHLRDFVYLVQLTKSAFSITTAGFEFSLENSGVYDDKTRQKATAELNRLSKKEHQMYGIRTSDKLFTVACAVSRAIGYIRDEDDGMAMIRLLRNIVMLGYFARVTAKEQRGLMRERRIDVNDSEEPLAVSCRELHELTDRLADSGSPHDAEMLRQKLEKMRKAPQARRGTRK